MSLKSLQNAFNSEFAMNSLTFKNAAFLSKKEKSRSKKVFGGKKHQDIRSCKNLF